MSAAERREHEDATCKMVGSPFQAATGPFSCCHSQVPTRVLIRYYGKRLLIWSAPRQDSTVATPAKCMYCNGLHVYRCTVSLYRFTAILCSGDFPPRFRRGSVRHPAASLRGFSAAPAQAQNGRTYFDDDCSQRFGLDPRHHVVRDPAGCGLRRGRFAGQCQGSASVRRTDPGTARHRSPGRQRRGWRCSSPAYSLPSDQQFRQ